MCAGVGHVKKRGLKLLKKKKEFHFRMESPFPWALETIILKKKKNV